MTAQYLPAPVDALPLVPSSAEELGILVDSAVDLAPNTITAYRGQWQVFQKWCGVQGFPSLPAEPRTVAIRLASRWEDAAAVSSLQLGRAAVRWVHRQAGAEDPTGDVAVTRFLGACSRGQAQAASVRGKVERVAIHQRVPLCENESRPRSLGAGGTGGRKAVRHRRRRLRFRASGRNWLHNTVTGFDFGTTQ